MTEPISIQNFVEDIRAIYKTDPSRAEVLIEAYLAQRLRETFSTERLACLEKVAEQFQKKDTASKEGPYASIEREGVIRLFSLLLGKKISVKDISTGELLEKMASSLETVFNSLNQIVGLIHTTLLGEKAEFETIRHIIDSQLEGEEEAESLQNYLDQIQKAFLIAHRGFQEAAQTKVGQILLELGPDQIEAAAGGGGLKFGPLRRAELFEVYKGKFNVFKGWFESGRFTEELLREFEKNCQRIYKIEEAGRDR
jgi:hypothetical protein